MCHVHACSLFVLLQTLHHSRTSFWNERCCLGNISKKICYCCCLHGVVEGQNSITARIRRETRCFVQTSSETRVSNIKVYFLKALIPVNLISYRWLALIVLMMNPNIVAICFLTKALTLTSGPVRRIPHIAIICITCMSTSCCWTTLGSK